MVISHQYYTCTLNMSETLTKFVMAINGRYPSSLQRNRTARGPIRNRLFLWTDLPKFK